MLAFETSAPARALVPLGIASRPARQVTLIADACCEIAPAVAQELGIVLLPRRVRADGKLVQLNAEHTLHSSCWPQRPRRLALLPQEMALAAGAVQAALQNGTAVLALGLPGRLDPSTRQAQAVRSILLAAAEGTQDGRRRIAVAELTCAGQSLGRLLEQAGRAAAEGLALHQLITLIDQLQAAGNSWLLTNRPLPAIYQLPERSRWPLLPGMQTLWQLSPEHGLFRRVAQGYRLTARLFKPDGFFHGRELCAAGNPASSLLRQINTGRAIQALPALPATPDGISLMHFVPDAVELADVPPADYVERIRTVIQRVEGAPPVRRYGVRQRGGF